MRASLFAVLAILSAWVAIFVEPLIPVDMPARIGADTVDNILEILASSMLAVTTFSLSVMVSSYSAATQNVTPRATRLLLQDTTSQTVLSTFVGSFLFSLVGIVTLGAGAYGERGRVVLFIVTLAVIVLIVVTILRWIDHLSRFGRVGDTVNRVEKAVEAALRARKASPYLGGVARNDMSNIPSEATPVFSKAIGYVQHVDLTRLSQACEDCDVEIYLVSTPGTYVHKRRPLVTVDGKIAEDKWDRFSQNARSAFTIDHLRSFDQDPRFGISVLAEIASRALSPGLNDTGTAIDVIGRAVRLMSIWAHDEDDDQSEAYEIAYPRVHVPDIPISEMFYDMFNPIARDGAALVEVQVRLQKALFALGELGGDFEKAAEEQSNRAMERAEQALTIEADIQRLRQLIKNRGK